jgi:hypothetical protein
MIGLRMYFVHHLYHSPPPLTNSFLSVYYSELQSEHLPLLIPSPNKGKTDNDTWIPNPGTSNLHLAPYADHIIG